MSGRFEVGDRVLVTFGRRLVGWTPDPKEFTEASYKATIVADCGAKGYKVLVDDETYTMTVREHCVSPMPVLDRMAEI